MTENDPPRQILSAEQTTMRTVDSQELFAGQKSVLIRHQDEIYRLLLTKNDKLILQK